MTIQSSSAPRPSDPAVDDVKEAMPSFMSAEDLGLTEEFRTVVKDHFERTWIPIRDAQTFPPPVNSRQERDLVAQFMSTVLPVFAEHEEVFKAMMQVSLKHAFDELLEQKYDTAEDGREFAIRQIGLAMHTFLSVPESADSLMKVSKNPEMIFDLVRLEVALFMSLDMIHHPEVQRLTWWARAAVEAARSLAAFLSDEEVDEEDDGLVEELSRVFTVPAEKYDQMQADRQKKHHELLPHVLLALRHV